MASHSLFCYLFIVVTALVSIIHVYPSLASPDKCTVTAPSSCVKMESSLCLDATLTYNYTYPYFWKTDQSSIHEYLNSTFSSMRKVPRCWTLLESLLCPVFFPKCDENRIALPSHEMCRNLNTSCKLIEPILRSLCSNGTLFPTDCDNKYKDKDIKFTPQAYEKCYNPILVLSEDEKILVPGTDCAFNCTDLRFPPQNQEALTNFVFKGSLLTSIVLGLALCSWIIDWKRVSRFPSNLTFHLCMCLFLVNLMFQHQFVKSKREIACRSDWTIRYALPSQNEDFHCIVSFLSLYYFSTAALVWLMIMAISWANYFSLKSSSKTESSRTCSVLGLLTNFPHLSAWCLPGVFIIIIWATNGIDGSYLLGICYAGINEWPQRIWFSLVPILISVLVSEYYFALCIKNLYISLRSHKKFLLETNKASNHLLYAKQKAKISVIKRAMFNILNLMLCVFGAFVVVIWANVHEYYKRPIWQENLTNHVNCLLNLNGINVPDPVARVSNPYKCNRKNDGSLEYKEPDLIHVYAQLACLFLISVSAASWTWTRATVMSWRRLILRCINAEELQMPYKVDVEALHDRRGPYQRVPTNNNFNCDAKALADPICMNLTSHEMSSASNGNLMNYQLNDAVHLELQKLKGRRKRKKLLNALFKRPAYDASSISDVSVCRSQNASSFKESIELASTRNSQLSLQDMRELKETVRRQRRKTRSLQKPHKFAHRNSDTSTQSLASNAFIAGKPGLIPLRAKCVSQSTSTGDLQLQPDPLQFLLVQQQTHNQQVLQSNMFQPSPMFNTSLTADVFGGKNQNFGHDLSHFNTTKGESSPPTLYQPPISPFTLGRIAILKRNLNPEDLVFSHGMIDHGDKLVNPLEEKRRPDSRIPYHTPSICTPIGMTPLHQNSGFLVNHQSFNMPNLIISPQNTFGLNTPQPLAQFARAPMANFGHLLPNQGTNLNFMPPQMANLNNQRGHFIPPPAPSTGNSNQMFQMSHGAFYVPAQATACTTLEELQTIVKERAQLLPICTQVPTDSELDNLCLPILISDSDACLTDGGSFQEPNLSRDKASDNSNLMIQQEVTERIKRIEEAAEQNENEENSLSEANGDISNNNNNNINNNHNNKDGVASDGAKEEKKSDLSQGRKEKENNKVTPRPRSLEEPNKRTRKKAFKKHYKK